jgi:hypothetical protein
MTLANSCTDSLTGLISSAVFNMHVLFWASPSSRLEAASCEYSFVSKDEMTFLFLDALDKLIKRKCLVFKLFPSICLALWCFINGDDFYLVSSLT